MPQINITDLTVKFKNKKTEVKALDGFCAQFASGAFNVVVGYSGCGKTTLLKTVAGLNEYTGVITFDGKDAGEIPIGARNFAYVSQNYVLYPNRTIFDNIAYPLKIMHAPAAEIRQRVYKIAGELGITDCLTRRPKDISGGQQQRTALGRALIKVPSLCLFDEPLSNLDEKTRTDLRLLIKTMIKRNNCTAIYVTHNMKEAMSLADTLTVMDGGKCSVSGNPQEVWGSQNEVVAALKSEEVSQW